jgi:hypothetical protein
MSGAYGEKLMITLLWIMVWLGSFIVMGVWTAVVPKEMIQYVIAGLPVLFHLPKDILFVVCNLLVGLVLICMGLFSLKVFYDMRAQANYFRAILYHEKN